MEIFSQATGAQLLFSASAVGVVLILAVIVFTLGFKTAEQPQFDKLPLVLEDRKSSIKKRKTKEKKSTSNGQAVQDTGSKNLESGKKSPLKDKAREPTEKAIKKEKKVKTVEVISEAKQKKKSKQAVVFEKPSDFDEGEWETVPTKSDKKKTRNPDDKKDSPLKEKKKSTNSKPEEIVKGAVEESQPDDVTSADDAASADEVNRALQEQVKNLQRILNEVEKRDSVPVVFGDPEPEAEVLEVAEPLAPPPEAKEKRKKKEKKPKNEEAVTTPSKVSESTTDENAGSVEVADSGVAFDELGDVWTEAKAPKKSKKKARKE